MGLSYFDQITFAGERENVEIKARRMMMGYLEKKHQITPPKPPRNSTQTPAPAPAPAPETPMNRKAKAYLGRVFSKSVRLMVNKTGLTVVWARKYIRKHRILFYSIHLHYIQLVLLEPNRKIIIRIQKNNVKRLDKIMIVHIHKVFLFSVKRYLSCSLCKEKISSLCLRMNIAKPNDFCRLPTKGGLFS